MSSTPPGWYPDANGTTRWWDGSQWTEHTQPAGGQSGQSAQAHQPAQGQYAQQGAAGQGWQQPGQGGQSWQQGTPAPGGKKKNKGLIWGIVAGVVALIAIAVVLLVVFLGGDDEDNADDPAEETTSSTEESEEPSEEPTEDESAEEPTDDGGASGEISDEAAAAAPKDADVDEFCESFDLMALSEMQSGSDLSELEGIQREMLAVGTPADMDASARRGWEWFASINGPEDAANMNTDDLGALGTYYGLNCM